MKLVIKANMSTFGQSKFSLYFLKLHKPIERNGKVNKAHAIDFRIYGRGHSQRSTVKSILLNY